VIGNDEPAKDISVSNVKISQTSFEDAPVTVQADVANSGYSGPIWSHEFMKQVPAAEQTEDR